MSKEQSALVFIFAQALSHEELQIHLELAVDSHPGAVALALAVHPFNMDGRHHRLEIQ